MNANQRNTLATNIQPTWPAPLLLYLPPQAEEIQFVAPP